MLTIVFPNGEFLSFDATPRQNHNRSADVSEYPTEAGGTITDNVRLKPVVLSFDVVHAPSNLRPQEPPDLGNPWLNTGAAIAMQGVRSVINFNLPDPTKPFRARNRLIEAMEKAEILRVNTTAGDYEGMVLRSIGEVREAKTADSFSATLEFQRIEVATATTVQVPALAVGTPRPGTAPTQQARSNSARQTRDRNTPQAQRGQRTSRPVTPAPTPAGAGPRGRAANTPKPESVLYGAFGRL